jgi:magnesium transporter
MNEEEPSSGDSDRRPPVGAVPGTLVEDPDAHPTRLLLMDFGPHHLDEREITGASELQAYVDKPTVTWLDVAGFRDTTRLQELAALLNIHRLALADAINVPQRAKAEPYQHYAFIVTHAPCFEDGELVTEQVSVLFGKHFVLTFQERPQDDLFNPLRERIRQQRGLVRGKGAAYLSYAIIDVITDHYFEALDERLDKLERRILKGDTNVIQDLYAEKHKVMDLRRAIETHRDSLSTLMNIQEREDPEDKLFLRDCLDHAISQSQMASALQDYTTSLRELMTAQQTQRMNEVMKVLTLVATIFIPLSFFAGVYGMNFDREQPGNMPELGVPYGYVIWWVVMILGVTAMLVYFRRRRWL